VLHFTHSFLKFLVAVLGENRSILQTLEGDCFKTMTEDRLPLTSQDVLTDRVIVLRELFPEVFAEGKVDFERLKQALGESVDEGRERYGLSWAGKSEAIRNLQAQSVGTLNPVPGESVNFETTENIFIEGDNLEVLKLLQKSYHNQIKMIYIDPPYNTGKEFIYPDNFREGLEDYLRYSGQKNGEGIKLTTNTETDGRFHSKWLNMMYPRLFSSQHLLCEEGIIFVSIDDHEIANLRLLMNAIFGEENFIGMFVWQSKKGGGSDTAGVVKDQEYVVCYGKRSYAQSLSKIEIEAEELEQEDENGSYRRGRELNKWGSNSRREDRPTMFFPILGPNGEDVYPIRNDGEEGCWRLGRKKMFHIVELGNAEFIKRPDGTYTVYEKVRSIDSRFKPFRTWLTDVGTTADGSKEVKGLFDGRKVYDFPKPTSLIKHLISIGTVSSDDIVLDFFAGSCTSAQALMELNQEEDCNRNFICIQLPELTPENSEARKAGYNKISEISKERIRRAINQINEEEHGKLNLNGSGQQDRGFKVFKLTESNFKIWDGTAPQNVEQLSVLLQEFAENIRPGTTKLGMLYEILLKAGFPLTVKVEKLNIAGQEIYAVEVRELFICLEYEISEDTVRQILTYQPKPKQFISLDSSFRGNDQLKTNTQLQMRDHDIKFRTA